jgi:hypothetical protein
MMVADFISVDFGWLRSPDGTRTARRILKPGKNWEGYFTNEDIQAQVQEAMDILAEFYPEYDHILIYDNASTHLKHEEDALSAQKMPKNTPKVGKNLALRCHFKIHLPVKLCTSMMAQPKKNKNSDR